MSRRLFFFFFFFLGIVSNLEHEFRYLKQKEDARRKLGYSTLQKCRAAILN
ncbi:hypothetical protein HanHA89_Chr10g0391011 [Helianthus annuus]|nr:hypothetical protein HanHA89_Chr10g0391011 [Helianthus annuus]